MGQRDAFLDGIVEKALDPYRHRVAPDVLQRMRELLADALATHPVASRLVDRGRPRDANDQSDDFEKGTLKPRDRGVDDTKAPAGSGNGEGT